jgi:hypothetical protein
MFRGITTGLASIGWENGDERGQDGKRKGERRGEGMKERKWNGRGKKGGDGH